MEEQNYSIEDLLADHSFQEYCLGSHAAAVAYWEHWLKSHPEKAGTVQSAKRIYFKLNGNITPEDYQQDYTLFKNAFAACIHPAAVSPGYPLKKTDTRRKAVIGLSVAMLIAAACLVVLLKFPLISSLLPDRHPGDNGLVYSTPMGKKRVVHLIDGTSVVLNGGTVLRLVSGYNVSVRELTLNGEAYFNVAHNRQKPFIVHTAKMDITDLGTIFNVKAYPADPTTEASLIQGAVEISLRHAAAKVMLTPNQKLVVTNRAADPSGEITGLPRRTYTVRNLTQDAIHPSAVTETEWTRNRLSFNDMLFEDVARQIERRAGIRLIITSSKVRKYRFTASFDQESTEEVLDALKLSAGFNYRKEGDTIIIY